MGGDVVSQLGSTSEWLEVPPRGEKPFDFITRGKLRHTVCISPHTQAFIVFTDLCISEPCYRPYTPSHPVPKASFSTIVFQIKHAKD